MEMRAKILLFRYWFVVWPRASYIIILHSEHRPLKQGVFNSVMEMEIYRDTQSLSICNSPQPGEVWMV